MKILGVGNQKAEFWFVDQEAEFWFIGQEAEFWFVDQVLRGWVQVDYPWVGDKGPVGAGHQGHNQLVQEWVS
jgi:hypothetical protein